MPRARSRWPFFASSAALFLVAGWFLLWSISAASLNFAACPEGYSIDAGRPECRRPRILELAALLALGGAVVTGIAGARRK
jgi:hypothetical protein